MVSDKLNKLPHHNYLNKDVAIKEAEDRIEELEEKIDVLEARLPKTYPDVKFQNYLSRKRILVSFFYFFLLMITYFLLMIVYVKR